MSVPLDSAQGSPKGLIAWFVNNHVAANILMAFLVIGGWISLSGMRTETFPSIDPGLITVTTVYPGATPYEVSDSITRRVEEALLGIDGVKRISSTATEGVGTVNIELQDFVDSDDVYNEVETVVNGLSDFPPENAERPAIVKAKNTPTVMTLALHGSVSERTLKHWAETIEDELRSLDGVALTSLSGIRDYQISIEVPELNLQRYGLTLEDIRRAVQNFSVDTPAGVVEARQGEVSLRVQSRRYTGQDFESIAVTTLTDGSILQLKDIGKVVDEFEDVNLVSKFNGEPAAFIDVKRSETEDTLAVAAAVEDYLAVIQLPTGLKLSLQKNETVNLSDRIRLMLRNAILGFMLVFLVLLLFLDLKLAFWVSAAVPVSFMGGLIIINALGYSINMITLFALIVVLGIVVDDAIVMGESIFKEQERQRENPRAVTDGVAKVIAPVTVGVTTTMLAFAPLALSTGTLGQIVGVIPAVVIPILFISLLEAFFILPAHLSSASRWSKGVMSDIREKFNHALQGFIEHYLEPGVRVLLQWRYATLAGFFAFLVITFSMVASGTIRFLFFPPVEGDEITINVTMPEGTAFATTQSVLLGVENTVLDIRNELASQERDPFQSVTVTIGAVSAGSGPGIGSSSSTNSNVGQLKIQLVPSDFRVLSSSELEKEMRDRIGQIPGAETLEFLSSPIGGQPDINIELSHPDEAVLQAAADELKNRISDIKGTREISDSFKEGNTEFIFELTQEGLAIGLTPGELGRQLRSAFFGLEAQRFQRGRSEVIVYVRYPKAERESLQALSTMRIRLPDGSEVPLSAVASITEQTGFAQINTVDGRRIVSITSDIDYVLATPNQVMAEINTTVLPGLVDRYAGLYYSFEGQSREQAEDLASVSRNMLIAVILIYVLLGSQLRSYTQPIIIMIAIPFGIVGAIWGHYLLGFDLTFISMFGIVALTGVVINDSVILMDYMNTHVHQNKSIFDRCLLSIKRRFRPILLTTLTTSLGLLPMLLETSMQARFLIPMVVSLAAGIIFVTVVIMVILPALILLFDDVDRLKQNLIKRLMV